MCTQKRIPLLSKPVSFAQHIKNRCWFQPIFGTGGFTIQPHLQADLEICLPRLLLTYGNNKAIFTWKANPLFSQKQEQPLQEA